MTTSTPTISIPNLDLMIDGEAKKFLDLTGPQVRLFYAELERMRQSEMTTSSVLLASYAGPDEEEPVTLTGVVQPPKR